MAETITCDPAQFITNRIELGLDDIGLAIRGEPDWGDSEMELFLVRQALGEIPADRRPPNRTALIDVMARKEGATSLMEAASKLQKKIGTWQREGGFVRRDLDVKGGFTTSVATQVHGASIGGIQGWLFAHRQTAPDIHLSLTTDPYFYGVNEIESGLFKAENVAHLKWEIANIKGSAPGLFRCQIKNEGAVDWKGLLAAMESRDLAAVGTRNTTADIVYECEALTAAGGTVEAAVAEASNGKVMKNSELSTGFINILNSKTLASGHMTHTGPRRVWLRAKDPNAISENIELKLVWRALGSAKWSENRAVRMPLNAGFAKVDLGEVLPEAFVLGEQRWEWKLMARARNGAGTVELDVTYVLPTEQMLAVNAPPTVIQPDGQSAKLPLTGENNALGSGKAWVNPGNILTSNNVYATCEVSTGLVDTQTLVAKKFGFAIPGAAIITGVVVDIERKAPAGVTINDWSIKLLKAGVLSGVDHAHATYWPEADTVESYGSSTDTWIPGLTPAEVNAEGFGVGIRAINVYTVGATNISVDSVKITVYYTTFADENRVCFAARSIELRSDGVYRQHLTDNIWGRGVPDGFLPYSPPSGLEARAVRGVIAPSQGDHLAVADAGNHKISARVFYFPGYLFVSEA